MKLGEITKKQTTKISDLPFTYNELYDEFKCGHTCCEIIEAYLVNNNNLLESNSNNAIKNFYQIPSDDPVIGEKYYGMVLFLVGDKINPFQTFFGELVNISTSDDGKKYYHIKEDDELVKEYPNKWSNIMESHSFLYRTTKDFNAARAQLKLQYGIDIQ